MTNDTFCSPGIRPAVTLATIERAMRDHQISVTLFGRRAVRDPRFVLDLRNGRTMRPGTVRRVAAFIASLGEA